MWTLSSLILWHRILATTLLLTAAPPPFLVVLDPGHGGTEKGACRPGTRLCEKTLTLQVAKEAAAELGRLPGIRVLLTRTDDRHVPLYARVAFARKAGADLLVSIHANASPKRDQTGYEIYVYPDEPRFGEPGTDEAGPDRRLAGWARDTILADLRRRGLGSCSRSFGARLRGAMHRFLGPRGDRGLLTGEMAVLAGASVPSVLFEMGFIDHRTEGRRLSDPAYRKRIVSALVLAIRRWAARAPRLGCRHRDLAPVERQVRRPAPRDPIRLDKPKPRLPRILRKHWPARRDRQLVVSAEPRWRRR